MAVRRSRILLLVLLIAVVASLWRAVIVEREKRQLSEAYRKAQELVDQLSSERAHLSGELEGAREAVEEQSSSLLNLQEELKRAQEQLDQKTRELTSLQQEQAQMRERNASLIGQLSSAVSEKRKLEEKLSSIHELRLAIREVKRKMWRQRLAAWQERIQSLKREDSDRLISGNRGYVIRQGNSTLGSNARLRVHVLEPQVQ